MTCLDSCSKAEWRRLAPAVVCLLLLNGNAAWAQSRLPDALDRSWPLDSRAAMDERGESPAARESNVVSVSPVVPVVAVEAAVGSVNGDFRPIQTAPDMSASPALAPVTAVTAVPSIESVPTVMHALAEPPAPVTTPVTPAAPPVPLTPLAPVSVERPPSDVWLLSLEDERIDLALKRWADKAGYAYRWDADRYFPIAAPTRFTGRYEDALRSLLSSPGILNSSYPLEACIYANVPPLVRITRLGDQSQECR